MVEELISLSVITLVALICPIIARLIPNKLIPETVFLLIAGAVLGPNMVGAIQVSDSISFLKDLGLGLLFLLAGYEINPKSLTGSEGKQGLLSWVISMALAVAFVALFPTLSLASLEGLSIAIILTTTALGTLMPILKDRGLMNTQVGELTLAYGTWGELCPVLAMALLLTSRGKLQTTVILLVFVAIAVAAALLPKLLEKMGSRLVDFFKSNTDGTAQMTMRFTMLLLVGMLALSALFDLDIVLGAFAAGFVLRFIFPHGVENLEHKLEGVAYGFLIPLFFIMSGATINLYAVAQAPLMLVLFVVLLLIIRAVPIYVTLRRGRATRGISAHSALTVALYCTTALPIIVAVTSVAVSAGALSQDTAGVLVAAGAVTVFLMPALTSVTYRVADVQPVQAVVEVAERPQDFKRIIGEHLEYERMMARQEAIERFRRKSSSSGVNLSWADAAAHLQRESARKRAMDEALDAAAQQIASNTTDEEYANAENARRIANDMRDELRSAIAERAWRDFQSRREEESLEKDAPTES